MADFFKQVWSIIVESNLLSVIGAVIILLIGWIFAGIVSGKIAKLVCKITGNDATLPDGTKIKYADTVAGKIVYYVIMIFAVLGCFSVLKLTAAAQPLQDFISTVAKYAPRIIGAALLVLVAWGVAALLKTLTRKALQNCAFVEKIGIGDKNNAIDYVARTIYYVVFLFFFPAILSALKIDGITGPLQDMFSRVLTYIPNIVAAAAILLIGFWIAGFVSKAAKGLIVITKLNSLGERAGVSKVFGNSGLAEMVGCVAYTLVAIPVIVSSLTALKIDVLSNSVAGFFNKLLNSTGNVIGAALIIFAATLFGGFASSLVAKFAANFGFDKFIDGLLLKKPEANNDGIAPSVVLGKIAYWAIMLMSILAACDILEFTKLAELINSFMTFGGNVLISAIVIIIGTWLANFVAAILEGKCGALIINGIRVAVIIFTIVLAVNNMRIGDGIVTTSFALILGAVCVTSAIAFGIGGKEVAAKLLNDWYEKYKK